MVRAQALRAEGALALLRLAHHHPGITRTEAAARLHLSSGSATELMSRLRSARLLAEVPAPPMGRGRPTTTLVPHPAGPLVAVVEINHETWRVTTAGIGGQLAEAPAHRRHGMDEVVRGVKAALTALRREHGQRLRAIGVSVAGTIRGTNVVQASTLGWRDVDLATLADVGETRLPLRIGNDASLAGIAEALRGASQGVNAALHLTVEVGIGGILVINGNAALGATGAGGEFGHMPFGEAELRCPCGAHGCWDLMVDGRAMARHLGRRAPSDPRSFADRTIAAARDGDPSARAAVSATATGLGRGVAALINALDPAIVTLGGLGVDLLDVAGGPLSAAVRRGLMAWRRDACPPIVAAALGSTGPAIGAAETAIAVLLTEQALADGGPSTLDSGHRLED